MKMEEIGSIPNIAKKDSKFRKFWNIEKRMRVLEQKFCLYCGKKFVGDKGSVLHHYMMRKKEFEIIEKKNLLKYYQTLKETHLICIKCHGRAHRGVYANWIKGQMRLF